MSDQITLLVESNISDGKLDELLAVVTRLKAHVAQTEPETLRYDWFIDADNNTARVVEVYATSEAVLFHAQNYASFAKELASLRTVASMSVCGTPSSALADAFSKAGAKFYAPV
ncbi:antibiotic biosynthesis monooxygenase [Pyruvatibacter sp.]|uniref:putative quinol monooxygenase n=1 Tax=Pyruvatibacter sp. TaxID=1981328 RepID=UPI003266A2A3